MKLARYVQRTRALRDLEVHIESLDVLELAIETGGELSTLLKDRATRLKHLSPRAILLSWRARRRLQAQKSHLRQVIARRRQEKQTPIPQALLNQTATPSEVAVLERADHLAPAGRQSSEHRRRDAIKEALNLWNASLVITRRDARLKVELTAEEEGLLVKYGPLTGVTNLAALSNEQWLTIREGEREVALELFLAPPMDDMVAQVEARKTALGPLFGGRDAKALLETLILADLAEAACDIKDAEALDHALDSAAQVYLARLSAPRPKAQLVVAVHVPAEGRLGVAVVQRDGRLVHAQAVEAGEDPVKSVEGVMGAHPVEAVVLPEHSERADVLEALAEGFGALEILRVEPRAIEAGVEALEDEARLVADAAPAVVHARRAVRPLKYWSQINPMLLEGADLPEGVDAREAARTLDEMRQAAAAGVKAADLDTPSVPPPRARSGPRTPPKPLNPMLKSINDLKPGMQIEGVITNIANFGAFVNVGLSHEGLIHISELAEHYVKEPAEVVKVGQQVQARVLGVDPGRGRISLSLRADRQPVGPRIDSAIQTSSLVTEEGAHKPTAESGPKTPAAAPEAPKKRVRLDDIPGRGRGRGGGRRRQDGPPGGGRPQGPPPQISRDQALAALDALFKKKD